MPPGHEVTGSAHAKSGPGGPAGLQSTCLVVPLRILDVPLVHRLGSRGGVVHRPPPRGGTTRRTGHHAPLVNGSRGGSRRWCAALLLGVALSAARRRRRRRPRPTTRAATGRCRPCRRMAAGRHPDGRGGASTRPTSRGCRGTAASTSRPGPANACSHRQTARVDVRRAGGRQAGRGGGPRGRPLDARARRGVGPGRPARPAGPGRSAASGTRRTARTAACTGASGAARRTSTRWCSCGGRVPRAPPARCGWCPRPAAAVVVAEALARAAARKAVEAAATAAVGFVGGPLGRARPSRQPRLRAPGAGRGDLALRPALPPGAARVEAARRHGLRRRVRHPDPCGVRRVGSPGASPSVGYGNRLFIDHGRVDGHEVVTAYNHAIALRREPGRRRSGGGRSSATSVRRASPPAATCT